MTMMTGERIELQDSYAIIERAIDAGINILIVKIQ
jgi:hypothetical protein